MNEREAGVGPSLKKFQKLRLKCQNKGALNCKSEKKNCKEKKSS